MNVFYKVWKGGKMTAALEATAKEWLTTPAWSKGGLYCFNINTKELRVLNDLFGSSHTHL